MTNVGLPLRNLYDNTIKLLMYTKDVSSFGYLPKAHQYMQHFQEDDSEWEI